MDRAEKLWFAFLILAALAFNVFTLSPVIPWQRWLLWSSPTPEQRIDITVENYQFGLPPEGIQIGVNKFVEFAVTSKDVTYGFGVFREDGTMVFQMQVVPGYVNRLLWTFDRPGVYAVRSTEYSGLRHPEMFVPNAIRVVSEEARPRLALAGWRSGRCVLRWSACSSWPWPSSRER